MVAAAATLHVCAGSGGGNTGRRRQAQRIASLVESHARCYAVGIRESAKFRGKREDAARAGVLGQGVCARSMRFSRTVDSPRHKFNTILKIIFVIYYMIGTTAIKYPFYFANT